MKQYVPSLMVVLAAALLPGCPIYPTEYDCNDDGDCPNRFVCGSANRCVEENTSTKPPRRCSRTSDCRVNETCGEDSYCHSGDCYYWGCAYGFVCVLEDYRYTCVSGASGHAGDGGHAGSGGHGAAGNGGSGGTGGTIPPIGGNGGAGNGGTGGDEPDPIPCGNPSDCGTGQVCSTNNVCEDGTCDDVGCVDGWVCEDAVCEYANPGGCMVDSECSIHGSGFLCINGSCTPPADQCTDKTQCPNPVAQSCVDGKCVATCASAGDCPVNYTCEAPGICSMPVWGCTITKDCLASNTVCVAGACVERCDENGACAAGLVCVANGCVPNQEPSFVCQEQGVQDDCNDGSICLHHSCYITCSVEADCASLTPDLSMCKDVETSSGPFKVCGSATNLGGECDLTAGASCVSGKVCIDGFCK